MFELHVMFDVSNVVSDDLWAGYDEWRDLRVQCNTWSQQVLGYCEWQFLELPIKMGVSTAVYSFVTHQHLRRFELCCQLHGLDTKEVQSAG